MNIYRKEILKEFVRKHSIALNAVQNWVSKVSKAKWKSFNELKLTFPTADYVGNNRVVFNIKGNDFRVVAVVIYFANSIEIRWVGTHAEYNKIKDCSLL
jgi:mRNA interferase HigB